MTEPEFNAQVNRLADTFGAQHYKRERTVILWRQVRDFDGKWLEHVIDGLIASSRYAPLPQDFGDAIGAERERIWKLQKAAPRIERATYACKYCRDNGVYTCRKPDEIGLWAFRCHCERGQNDPRRAIPAYTQSHAEMGITYYDIMTEREAREEAAGT